MNLFFLRCFGLSFSGFSKAPSSCCDCAAVETVFIFLLHLQPKQRKQVVAMETHYKKQSLFCFFSFVSTSCESLTVVLLSRCLHQHVVGAPERDLTLSIMKYDLKQSHKTISLLLIIDQTPAESLCVEFYQQTCVCGCGPAEVHLLSAGSYCSHSTQLFNTHRFQTSAVS